MISNVAEAASIAATAARNGRYIHMDYTINFKVKGERRKTLVRLISQYMETPAKYQWAPTFAFCVDYITIDRTGAVSFDDRADGQEIEGLIEFLAEHGFEGTSNAGDTDANLGQSASTVQTREADANPGQTAEEAEDAEIEDTDDTADGIHADCEQADETQTVGEQSDRTSADLLTISVPRTSFTDTALLNLHKIIDSKASLLRKALNTDSLEIIETDDQIRFPWFHQITPTHTAAYTHLVTALCSMAKAAKRVVATDKAVASEKYAMRIWLMRLGFGGPEHKTDRAILLRNLSGTAAFKDAASAEAFNLKHKKLTSKGIKP